MMIFIFQDSDVTPSSEVATVSPTKRRISNGIQSIMSRLSLSRESSFESANVEVIIFKCDDDVNEMIVHMINKIRNRISSTLL